MAWQGESPSGEETENRIRGGDLPRLEPGELSSGFVHECRGGAGVCGRVGGGGENLWLEAARLCGDAKPLPSGAADAAAEFDGWDALAAEHLRDTV